MGAKSAANVVRNIENSKTNPLPRVLTALGIRFVGERTAVFLAEAFGSLDAIAAAGVEELQQAEEVGPKVAESVFQFFREPRNRELVERLRAAGLQFTYESARPKGGPLQGLTFVLTGTLPTSEPRGGQAADRARGRKSERLGEQEDQLRGGRRGCRLQARQGAGTRRRGARRTPTARTDRGRLKRGADAVVRADLVRLLGSGGQPRSTALGSAYCSLSASGCA